MIFGGIALLTTFQPGRGVADAAHLGGLIFGYLYLKGGRGGLHGRDQVPLSEVEDEPAAHEVRRLLRRPFDQRPLHWIGGLHGRPETLTVHCESTRPCDPASPA